ncbi:hypothetical protein D3C72_1629690 [compost metagenome]
MRTDFRPIGDDRGDITRKLHDSRSGIGNDGRQAGQRHRPEGQESAAAGNGIDDTRQKAGRKQHENDEYGHGPSQGFHAISGRKPLRNCRNAVRN